MSSSKQPQTIGPSEPRTESLPSRDAKTDSSVPPTGLRALGRFYRVFGRHYGRHVPTLVAALTAMLAGIGLALLVPWPLAWVIDYVIKGETLPGWLATFGWTELVAGWIRDEPRTVLAACAASFVLIKLLHAIATFLDKYLVAKVSEFIATDIRERAFTHLQRLSLSFHRSVETSDLIVRLTRDIGDIRDLLLSQPEALFRSLLTIAAFAGTMLWLNWKLALVAFTIVPVLGALAHWTQTRVRGAERKRRKKESKLALVVNENVRALSLVQAYGQERAENEIFEAENRQSLDADVRLVKLERRFKRATDMLIASATAGVLYLGGRAVIGNELTLGAFIVFYTYIEELYGPVDKLITTILGFARNQVAGERILELIESDMVMKDRRGAVPAPPLSGRIEFEDVSFSYARGTAVLRGVSFAIEPGETVALVGPSGAGKSTLIALLLRFFDPESGRILVDGTDIRDLQVASLRNQLTILPQEATLLNRSLRDNIAFADPGASEDEIVRAAQRARGTRVHPGASRGLRPRPQRGRRRPLRWTAPAHSHRPRDPARRAHRRARRTLRRSRRRVRGQRRRGTVEPDRRAHRPRDRPPSRHDRGRRSDPGPGRRHHRRAGNPRAAPREELALPRAVREAARTSHGGLKMSAHAHLPNAPEYPQVRELVDRERANDVFGTHLGPRFAEGELRLEGIDIERAYYTPGPKGSYRLKLRATVATREGKRVGEQVFCGQLWPETALSDRIEQARERSLCAPGFGEPLAIVPPWNMLLWAFPNDPEILHLSLLAGPDTLLARARRNPENFGLSRDAELLGVQSELVKYVPARRCTWCCRFELAGGEIHEIYAKMYRHRDAPRAFERLDGPLSRQRRGGNRASSPEAPSLRRRARHHLLRGGTGNTAEQAARWRPGPRARPAGGCRPGGAPLPLGGPARTPNPAGRASGAPREGRRHRSGVPRGESARAVGARDPARGGEASRQGKKLRGPRRLSPEPRPV